MWSSQESEMNPGPVLEKLPVEKGDLLENEKVP